MREDLAEQQGLLLAFIEALAPASRSPELREKLAGSFWGRVSAISSRGATRQACVTRG